MRPAIRSQVFAMTSRSARPFSAETVRPVYRHLAASCRYSSGLFIGSCRLAGGQPRVRNTRQCAPFPRESEPRHWNAHWTQVERARGQAAGPTARALFRFGPLKDPSRTSLEVRSLLNFMRIARDAHTPDLTLAGLRCRAAVALNSATQT